MKQAFNASIVIATNNSKRIPLSVIRKIINTQLKNRSDWILKINSIHELEVNPEPITSPPQPYRRIARIRFPKKETQIK